MTTNDKKKITGITVLLLLIAIIPVNAYAQKDMRWNIKASYSSYVSITNGSAKNIKYPGFRAEANYSITSYLEAGIYAGFLYADFVGSTLHPTYGINVNFHVLPLIVKDSKLRFDPYVTGKFGGMYLRFPTPVHDSEYGLGVGLAYYIWKNVGIYAEYSYGKYYHGGKPQRNSFRYGVSFRF